MTVPVSASVIPPVGPIGDDYGSGASTGLGQLPDPDNTKWVVTQESGSTPYTCEEFNPCIHDLWVDNPPGYLFSQNKACTQGTTCEFDARLVSNQTPLSYDIAGGLNMLLRERFSPNINAVGLCGTFFLTHAYRLMHVLSLQYAADDPATTDVDERQVLLWLSVHHDCSFNGWKMYLATRYHDASGGYHDAYETWSPAEINPDDWLDLSIEVRDNGQNTLLSAKNLSTGLTYSKAITSWIGTRSLPVQIAIQYRHNEKSRTDFVDFRLTQNDCGSLTDAGDSFGASVQMPSPPTCDGSLAPSIDGEDWYWRYADIGKRVKVTITSGLDVSFYRPDGSFAVSCLGTCIHAPTDQPGNWRVRIYSEGWSGTYSFTFSVEPYTWGGGCSDGCYPV